MQRLIRAQAQGTSAKALARAYTREVDFRVPAAAFLVRHEQLTCHCVPTLLHSVTVCQTIHNTKQHQIYQHTLPWDWLYSSSYLSHIFIHHCLELAP